MDLTDMDYIRAAIANALIEGMTTQDLWAMAEHAPTPEAFDHAVNMLAQATPDN